MGQTLPQPKRPCGPRGIRRPIYACLLIFRASAAWARCVPWIAPDAPPSAPSVASVGLPFAASAFDAAAPFAGAVAGQHAARWPAGGLSAAAGLAVGALS